MSTPQDTLWTWILDEPQKSESTVDLTLRADQAILDALESEEGSWSGTPRSLSRSQLKKIFDEDRVTRNGKKLRASERILLSDRIEMRLPPVQSLELVPENIPLDILFEDAHLIVVNKQPGLTVHPSETQKTGTLVHALLHHVKDLSGIGGVLRPGIVHRIDKDTSGALVITKTDEAHVKLAEVFARHDIDREYWAICYGAPDWQGREFRLETLIGRNPNDRMKMSIEVKEGRKAISHFSRREAYGIATQKPFASLIQARLETGRTHQIRVHLTALHHSILGDPLYGTPTSNQPKWKALPKDIQALVEKLPGQALHAATLGFRHPITGEPLKFTAKPPLDFQRLLDGLANYR